MGYTIEQIEDAIISEIQGSSIGVYCKKVESYAGQLEEDIGRTIILYPAVFVMFSRSNARMLTGIEYEKSVTFTLFVVSKSLKSNTEARKDDYGTYRMLDDLEALLVGNQLGLQIEPLSLVSEDAILTTKQFSIYAAEYKVSFVTE